MQNLDHGLGASRKRIDAFLDHHTEVHALAITRDGPDNDAVSRIFLTREKLGYTFKVFRTTIRPLRLQLGRVNQCYVDQTKAAQQNPKRLQGN